MYLPHSDRLQGELYRREITPPDADQSVTELVCTVGRLSAGVDYDCLGRDVDRGSRLKIEWTIIGLSHHGASTRNPGIRDPIDG